MQDHHGGPRYCAYLLRCWQERSRHPQHPTTWRFSLHDPHTQAQTGFATLDDLFAALRIELAECDRAPLDDASTNDSKAGAEAAGP